jgi:hypothetical protein
MQLNSDSRKLHVEYMEAAAALTANSFSELSNCDGLHIKDYQSLLKLCLRLSTAEITFYILEEILCNL